MGTSPFSKVTLKTKRFQRDAFSKVSPFNIVLESLFSAAFLIPLVWTIGENVNKSLSFQTKAHIVWMGP